MIDPPKTLVEAVTYRYGQWAGNPGGTSYEPECCAYEPIGRGWYGSQCTRKPGHGPAKLYCKQHAKIVGDYFSRRGRR